MSKFVTKKLPQSPIKKEISSENNSSPLSQKKKIRKILGISIIVLGLFFGITSIIRGIGNIQVGTIDNGNIFQAIIVGSSGTSAPEKKGITNILIAGIGGADHEGGNLTDSIMLASLDPDKKTVTLLSIPRDLYVNYGTGSHAGKINALYQIGLSRKEGILPLAAKVSEITGQSIHHYMVVDFSAFRYIVDALGGISVDVPKDLYDAEYPDYNYGYRIFSVKKGLQTMDGETALSYARSRHSTSDIDRSMRQQLIINAIKTKSLSLGIITSPTKISELIDATRKNINTDLTVADIVSLGTTFASMDESGLHVYNLGNDCSSYTICQIGAYLYNPSMAYFGGAWAVIPEGARINQISYYDRIHRFVDFVFQYPGIHVTPQPIIMVSSKETLPYAKNLLMEMRKIGINYDVSHVLLTATGKIAESHINIYYNQDYDVGIHPDSDIIMALRSLDMRIPVHIVTNNEYMTTDGPKIEIVLGADHKSYFDFARPPTYLPKIEEKTSTGSISGESAILKSPSLNHKKSGSPIKNTPSPSSNLPKAGEWEDL